MLKGISRPALLRHIAPKNCFIHIPASWKYLPPLDGLPLVFEVIYGANQVAYFSWDGEISKNSPEIGNVVEINSLLAKKLKLADGEEVIFTEVSGILPCESVYVKPENPDDYEIVLLNQQTIQLTLLNQVRIVWKGQILPVKISKNLVIFLQIESLSSGRSVGRLDQGTEIHVTPDSIENASSETPIVHKSDDPKLTEFTQREISFNENNSLNSLSDSGNTNSTKNIPNILNFISYVMSELKTYLIPDYSSKTQSTEPEGTENTNSCQRIVDPITSFMQCKTSFKCKLRVHPIPDILIDDIVSSSGSATVSCKCDNKKLLQFELEHLPRHFYGVAKLCELIKQPSTVFLLSETLQKTMLSSHSLPAVFIGKLSAFHSLEKNMQEMKHSPSETQQKAKSTLSSSKLESKEEKRKTKSFTFVKVVILDKLYWDRKTSKDSMHLLQILYRHLIPDCVLLSDIIRQQLNLDIADKVILESTEVMDEKPRKISVTTNLPSVDAAGIHIEKALSEMSSRCCPLVATDGTLIPVEISDQDELISGNVMIMNDSSSPLLLYPDSIHGFIDVRGFLSLQLPLLSSLNLPKVGMEKEALGCVSTLVTEGVQFLRMALRFDHLAGCLSSGIAKSASYGGALLICGSHGSGKSAVAAAICEELAKSPHFVFTTVISCKQLRGKQIDFIKKEWRKVFARAVYKSPAVVILEDLDHLASASTGPDDEVGAVAVYNAHVAQALQSLLKWEIPLGCRIALVATSKSKLSLHSSLASSRGHHFFQKIITIPPLDKVKRIDILKALILQRCSHIAESSLDSLDIEKIVSGLEGCVAQDLKVLVDRATHCSYQRLMHDSSEFDDAPDEIPITDSDFERALKGFTPTCLKGVQLHHGGHHTWKSIGGLKDVKKMLKETLEWPAKFPELFSQCPLRLRSGLLLYGPPGTGKTLLASVVAKECGLHLISIKGPELLSKYIGASEESVRKVFQRAQSAKPCILFFDEFDALAPRRGHDNTGVTDRVVNQLLTQMDGIESLEGVYILAATSRPDLIDPALLRPGRLDKCLHCPLPTPEEQLEIVTVLSSNVNLESSVDFEAVVKLCENFTGADFQALLYNAQLLAIRDTRESSSLIPREETVVFNSDPEQEEGKVSSPDVIPFDSQFVYCPSLEDGAAPITQQLRQKLQSELEVVKSNVLGFRPTSDHQSNRRHRSVQVTQEHLIAAAKEMRPSVTDKERLKYKKIYEAFVKSRGGDFSEVAPTGGMRATLA